MIGFNLSISESTFPPFELSNISLILDLVFLILSLEGLMKHLYPLKVLYNLQLSDKRIRLL